MRELVLQLLFSLLIIFQISPHAYSQDSSNHERTNLVFLHGLNHRPTHFKALINAISNEQTSVNNSWLYPHDKKISCDANISNPVEIWRSQVDELLQAESTNETILIGYSLGSLLALDRAVNGKQVSAMILIAPPLRLNFTPSLVFFLLPLKYFGVSLPSLAPKRTQICPSTPLSLYSAVLRLKQEVTKNKLRKLHAIPTLVILSKKDEFVDSHGVKSLLAESGLTQWKVLELENSNKDLPAHLVIDQQMLGDEQWQKLIQEIKEFTATVN